MLVKISIGGYASRKALLDYCIGNAMDVIQPQISRYKASGAEQAQERALYSISGCIVAGTLKSKYKASGDITYKHLSDGLQAALRTALSNHSVNVHSKDGYSIVGADTIRAEQAASDYNHIVTAIYSRRIDRALASGKAYINLITTKALHKLYSKCTKLYYSNDTIHMTLEVVHDIIAVLLEQGVDISKLSNDYNANRDYLSSIWYDMQARRINGAATIREDGVYKSTEDGAERRVASFSSHIYYNVLLNDFAAFDGKHTIVYRYRSLWTALYSLCNTYIERERRNYTSNQPYLIETEDGETVNLIDYKQAASDIAIEIADKDIFTRLRIVLLKAGVKDKTAKQYVIFTKALCDGYKRKEAAIIAGMTEQYYRTLTKTHSVVIHSILPQVFKFNAKYEH